MLVIDCPEEKRAWMSYRKTYRLSFLLKVSQTNRNDADATTAA